MPVQINGSAAVERGPGLAPPPVARGGTVELRLHGVGGTTPDNLLGDLAPQQVSGDRIAGFYEADVDQRGRKVEAYCWGGMTSRSSSRVLWLLLFPFMLVNLAGWGVWLNGIPLRDAVALTDGDQLTVGSSRFAVRIDPAADAPIPESSVRVTIPAACPAACFAWLSSWSQPAWASAGLAASTT